MKFSRNILSDRPFYTDLEVQFFFHLLRPPCAKLLVEAHPSQSERFDGAKIVCKNL